MCTLVAATGWDVVVECWYHYRVQPGSVRLYFAQDSPCDKKKKKNGENWLQNHLWCPNDPRGQGIDDDDDDDDDY